jgi:NitT/TauT family transport system substrate-binding protein
VFKQDWGDAHKTALRAFFAATQQAHNRLCQDDSTWQAVAPLADAPDAATQQPLRQRYCEGRIEQWGARQQQAAESLYRLIRQGGDNKLTGNAEQLQAGTFWSAD